MRGWENILDDANIQLSVRDKVVKRGNCVKYILWDSCIAWCDVYDSGTISICMCGYNTNTTRSRLNAILHRYGFYIRQRNGIPYLVSMQHSTDTVELDDTAIYQVSREGIKEAEK